MKNFEEDRRIVEELSRQGNGPDPFSSAVRATRMPMVITDPKRSDNPIVFVNAAFTKLTGYERHEIIGRNCRFLQGPQTDRSDVEKLKGAITSEKTIEIDLLNYRKNGSTFWNRVLVSPVFDNDGILNYFFASQFDVTVERERLAQLERERHDLATEVSRRDAELIASEQRLQFALKAGRMGSWSLDLQTRRLIASDGCKENFGWPLGAPFSYQNLLDQVHPDDRARRDVMVEAAITAGAPLDVEFRLLTPSNDERWVQINGQASYRADGTPLALVGICQDITERKQAEEHRTLLAAELSHRVKNSLAMIQAIISQTLRRASSLAEAGVTLQARIMAMSAANDLLVAQRWKSASLRQLLRQTLVSFGIDDGAQFELAGPDVMLPPRLASLLALGLHELATNASKYGALSTERGRVRITWEKDRGVLPHQLHLIWSETGGPPVSQPQRTGFGSKLIDRVLAKEAGGQAELEYLAEGVRFALNAPLLDEDDDS